MTSLSPFFLGFLFSFTHLGIDIGGRVTNSGRSAGRPRAIRFLGCGFADQRPVEIGDAAGETLSVTRFHFDLTGRSLLVVAGIILVVLVGSNFSSFLIRT